MSRSSTTQQLAPGQSGPVTPLDELESGTDLQIDDEGEFWPKRFWTAGPGAPQEQILLKGGRRLVPRNYSYVIETPEERTVLLQALPGRVWEEDFRPAQPDFVCTHRGCAGRLRAVGAIQAHMDRCHPTGSSTPGLN